MIKLRITLLTGMFLSLLLRASVILAQDNLEPAAKEIMKITDSGLSPRVLHLNKRDSSVFFYNATQDSLTTLAVVFGTKRMHCSSANLKMGEDGVLRSTAPFGPRDFSITCFPDRGTYALKVYGLPRVFEGAIIVE